MPLHPPTVFSKSLRGLNLAVGAVWLCLAASSATAQPTLAPIDSAVCLAEKDWPSDLRCLNLNQKTGFIDIAVQESTRQLHAKLPQGLLEPLQTQQRDWEQRRDKDCMPTDKPATESSALFHAQLCRNKMALQRTQLLQSALDVPESPPTPLDPTCTNEQALSLPCWQQRQATVEHGMNTIYRAVLLRLPELQAHKFYADQDRWLDEREQYCAPRRGAPETADQVSCQWALAMQRIKVYQEVWAPRLQQQVQP